MGCDGVANLDDVWSHRLEGKLVAKYGGTVEVLSWSRKGWSTHRQLRFLKDSGSEFDFLIVGHVSNDPHIPRISMAAASIRMVKGCDTHRTFRTKHGAPSWKAN